MAPMPAPIPATAVRPSSLIAVQPAGSAVSSTAEIRGREFWPPEPPRRWSRRPAIIFQHRPTSMADRRAPTSIASSVPVASGRAWPRSMPPTAPPRPSSPAESPTWTRETGGPAGRPPPNGVRESDSSGEVCREQPAGVFQRGVKTHRSGRHNDTDRMPGAGTICAR